MKHQPNTTYTHALSGQQVTIKKIYGQHVASCTGEIHTIPDNTKMKTDIYVCQLKYLIPNSELNQNQ